MVDSVEVTEEIKQFVSEVLSTNGFGCTARIKYFPGSELGDGYGSKTVGVDAEDGEKSLHLFLKCALSALSVHPILNQIYETETLFYKTIYPTYQTFLNDKRVFDGFRNIPKCYGVLEKVGCEIIGLENLRRKNFRLFNTFTLMNDDHLRLILEAYARFHAISFAMKDQRREMHDSFIDGRTYIFELSKEIGFDKVITNVVNEFVSKLDSEEDKDILDRCENLAANTTDQVILMGNYLTQYATLTKGDCWVNNMMFLYENENEQRPLDLMLVDWQGVCRGSPVHDLGALFLEVSSKETLDNYQYYRNLYYDELSKRIRELGSDPEVLYPRHVLETEWVKYGLHSFGLAILTVKVMLREKTNATALKVEKPEEFASAADDMFRGIRDNEDQVVKRWKYIARHLIKLGVF